MCLADKVKEIGIGYGMGAYSDSEILSMLTGIKEKDVDKITLDDPLENRKIDGVGREKVMRIAALGEYMRRLNARKTPNQTTITGPSDVYAFLKPRLYYESREHFCLLTLDMKNHVTGFRVVSIGSLSASVVHPREVFRPAIINHAASIIVAHNHPSGDPTPSREDVNVTQRLVKAGHILDIPVLDHIIIGSMPNVYGNTESNRWLSLKEGGMI